MEKFIPFPKIGRLRRGIVITEKIDGTNAQIFIGEDGQVLAGSRNRWVTPENDNYGFARWAKEHEEELRALGPGRHYGEWWGNGIQRGYGLPGGDKRFSLFNTGRWLGNPDRPTCCRVVPLLYAGPWSEEAIDNALLVLQDTGSLAAPFMNPEGIVIFHTATNTLFKRTIKDDDSPKGQG